MNSFLYLQNKNTRSTLKCERVIRQAKQRGDFLIESLIGMVLMAIIGMGVVFVTSKVTTNQTDMRFQEIIVNQLRAALVKNGAGGFDVCTENLNFTLPNNEEVEVETQGCNETATATIDNSITVTNIPKPIFLKATYTINSVDQEIVVGGTWQ